MRIREVARTGSKTDLLALRNSDLYQECYEWGSRQAVAASQMVGGSQLSSARNAAAIHTICYALDAYAGFVERYTPAPAANMPHKQLSHSQLEQAFLSQISPAHRNNLLNQFHATFHANNDERQAALLSALDPQLRAKLSASGVTRSGNTAKLPQLAGADVKQPGINEAELLALLDYLSSATGPFNVVNGAAMALSYYGETSLQS
jgi:hypothetical protein